MGTGGGEGSLLGAPLQRFQALVQLGGALLSRLELAGKGSKLARIAGTASQLKNI